MKLSPSRYPPMLLFCNRWAGCVDSDSTYEVRPNCNVTLNALYRLRMVAVSAKASTAPKKQLAKLATLQVGSCCLKPHTA